MERTKFPNDKPKEPSLDESPNLSKTLITKGIFDKLREYDNVVDITALYVFYRDCAIHQKTDQIYATNEFCWGDQGLRMSRDKFFKAKKVLEELGLIKQMKPLSTKGRFGKPILKVNFVYSDNPKHQNTSTALKNKALQPKQVIKTDNNNIETSNNYMKSPFELNCSNQYSKCVDKHRCTAAGQCKRNEENADY
jgi:hypothetical protein